MAAKIFHWLMIIMCVIVSLWLLRVLGQVFVEHLGLFVFLWFFFPSLAFWFGSRFMKPEFSTATLSLARKALMSGVILISVLFFVDYNHVRDIVGHRFVEGYSVYYYEDEYDTDEYGGHFPFSSSEIHADHRYARLGLWVFEGSLLILIIGLPYLTWYACTKAVKASVKENGT